MIDRRTFLKSTSVIASGLFFNIKGSMITKMIDSNKRPPLNKRNFTSEAIEKAILEVKENVKNEKLASLFENCFPNTLDTTVKFSYIDGKPDTFVITGDIEAMWLRDSSAQVYPYLQVCSSDDKLKELIAGVINRQVKCILIDPYANAFNFSNEGSGWESDITGMKPDLHERKWEIDSLCYPIRLSYGFWKETGDISYFDSNWIKAMKLVFQTFKEQQRKENKGPYSFLRKSTVPYDTQALGGFGNPINPVGLICSAFRPSDDSTIYPFLIPSNLFAVKSLRDLAEIFTSVIDDKLFASDLKALADEVGTAVYKYAVVEHLDFGKVFAYEVDGFGNRLFMDDANVPSLLSLPYLGILEREDDVYKNTRNFILSKNNPYFFKGKFAEGIGGPHIGLDMIWHMSITMRTLTSSNDDEIKYCIELLSNTDAGTGFMHESFHKDDPANYTRSWFAWANTLFGELIYNIYKSKPELLKG